MSRRMIVDVQNHVIPPEILVEMLESGLVDVSTPPPTTKWHGTTMAGAPGMVDIDLHMSVCREAGLTHVMLFETMLLTTAREVMGTPTAEAAKRNNDAMGGIRDQYPDLVYPLGTVKPHDGPAAVAEARRCLDELGFKGLAIESSYGTTDLTFIHTPETFDFWEFVNEREVPVFIHPPFLAYGWEWGDRYRLDETVIRANGTGLCVSFMILSGLFDRFPRLKVVLPHAGGSFLMILPRLQFGHRLGYEGFLNYQKAVNQREPMYYAREHIWVDTMGFYPPGIRLALDVLGTERVLLGTDYGPLPFSPKEHIDIVRDDLGLNREDQDKILGLNAKNLFGLEEVQQQAGDD